MKHDDFDPNPYTLDAFIDALTFILTWLLVLVIGSIL